MFCSRAWFSTARGRHRTNISRHVSKQRHTSAGDQITQHLIIERLHSSSSFGYSVFFLMCHYFRDKKQTYRHTPRPPHMQSSHGHRESCFPLLGTLPPLTDVTLNNTLCSTTFVRWLNVMSSQCYFSLSQLLGISVASSSRGPAILLVLVTLSTYPLTPRNPCFSTAARLLSKTPLQHVIRISTGYRTSADMCPLKSRIRKLSSIENFHQMIHSLVETYLAALVHFFCTAACVKTT